MSCRWPFCPRSALLFSLFSSSRVASPSSGRRHGIYVITVSVSTANERQRSNAIERQRCHGDASCLCPFPRISSFFCFFRLILFVSLSFPLISRLRALSALRCIIFVYLEPFFFAGVFCPVTFHARPRFPVNNPIQSDCNGQSLGIVLFSISSHLFIFILPSCSPFALFWSVLSFHPTSMSSPQRPLTASALDSNSRNSPSKVRLVPSCCICR